MQALTVSLKERSYPIYIGQGLLDRAELLSPHLGRSTSLVVTNETVAPLYLEKVQRLLPGGYESVILPDGEAHKTLDTANIVYDALMRNRFGRDCCLLALGGGVIGDITGFVAATYQRGVDFIQIPTTLLAQVDSSVGGKTGVNHPLGKNMIGAFHQPRVVISDTDTLKTLPERELKAGLAEVIKYGLLGDAEFFTWLEANIEKLLHKDPAALAHAIARSCEHKARIVAADERESGERALLNLGHSFAHAIETATGYKVLLHGEAVGTGICLAADLSCRLGWLAAAERDRAINSIRRAGLPAAVPSGLTPQILLKHMSQDKKVLAGKLRLVLLKGIGKALVTADFDPHKLQETLEAFCSADAAPVSVAQPA
ncbi:MAG: 3-dehydroquinate synthase [Nevskiales bacterium]